MKRYHVITSVFLLPFVVYFIVSCNKNKEDFTRPQQGAPVEAGSKDATGLNDLSSSSEGSSPRVTWDQAPAELKMLFLSRL
jgi:hypothetical protein